MRQINALSDDEFVTMFGYLYEHSPWVIRCAEKKRPFMQVDDMLGAMIQCVADASKGEKLTLLRAHPPLAGKAAIDGTLTDASKEEQASAGLDRLSTDEYALFHERNDLYEKKFNFPFIICVKLNTKTTILNAMAERINNDVDTEKHTALDEVNKIVKLRFEDVLSRP